VNGRSYTVTMTYDAMNRLKERIVPQVTYGNTACYTLVSIPGGCYWTFPMLDGANTSMCILADTARFHYDASGNMVRADNRYARVRRGYAPNGALTNDTLRIRTVNEPGDHACGSAVPGAYYGGNEWNAHVYVMENTYDLAGRRLTMKGPYSLSGCSKFGGVGICTTTWAYAGGGGELSSVKDGLNRDDVFHL
jgi:hypothetical protein